MDYLGAFLLSLANEHFKHKFLANKLNLYDTPQRLVFVHRYCCKKNQAFFISQNLALSSEKVKAEQMSALRKEQHCKTFFFGDNEPEHEIAILRDQKWGSTMQKRISDWHDHSRIWQI